MTTDEQLREANHTLEEATRAYNVAAIRKEQAQKDLDALKPEPEPEPEPEAPAAPVKKHKH